MSFQSYHDLHFVEGLYLAEDSRCSTGAFTSTPSLASSDLTSIDYLPLITGMRTLGCRRGACDNHIVGARSLDFSFFPRGESQPILWQVGRTIIHCNRGMILVHEYRNLGDADSRELSLLSRRTETNWMISHR